MQQPIKGELRNLAAVHSFYAALLEKELGYPLPVPEVVEEALRERADDGPYIRAIKRWVGLLDLAVSPHMVRDGLKESTSLQTAIALLRYYVDKASPADHDRDKADSTVTWIFREFAAANPGHHPDQTQTFQQRLEVLLEGVTLQEVPSERRHLISEFDFLRQEAEEFRHFDAVMDSGIMQRVREIKSSLQFVFYHPQALAAAASYNHFFGARFDELFRTAAGEIRSYADRAQKEGASIASRVEGDITVQQLQQVQEDKALNLEYGRAQAEFRKVAKLKQAVDKRAPARAAAAASAFSAAGSSDPAPRNRILDNQVEVGKLIHTRDNIVLAMREMNPKKTPVVTMDWGNLVLTPAEADSFRAEFRLEKSFRGEFAHVITQLVALYARMAAELRELARKKDSSQFLWKPHADSLKWLLEAAKEELANAERIHQIALQRGLADKAVAITATLDRVRTQMRQVSAALL